MKPLVKLILNGRRNDRGFVQEGLKGALSAREAFGVELDVIEHSEKDADLLLRRVEAAAAAGADGVIVHGSRADAPIETVAPHHPDCKFLSPGGYAEGPNVWNYAVRHFEAAYLAGVLAARMTRSGVVGHLSGVFITPGKRGRAAFVHGARAAAPEIEVVTGFCGDQDDPKLAAEWVAAEADAGADVIFTMLNFGRSGAIDACRTRGIKQIGNIRNWCDEEPDVFIGSALARHRWSVHHWIGDLATGALASGVNRSAGLETPEAVRLSVGKSVPADIAAELDDIARKISVGEIAIAKTYDGPEFHPPVALSNAG